MNSDDSSTGDRPTPVTDADPSASAGKTVQVPTTGPEIPGYRVKRLLGKGGMGRVYLAEDETLGREVAIKVVSRKLAEDDEAQTRFLREARAMAAVEHRHIVHVHTFGEVDGQPYFVMQYVAGESVAERVRRSGPLPVDDALRIIAESVEALAAAWCQHIIHRDLKPANILIATDGSARVVDFGLAKQTRLEGDLSLTDRSHVLGTPYYVSPEQARGVDTDFRSDIYSLGILFFEMLTGSRPFQGPTPLSVVAQHLEQPLPSVRALRPEVPEEVEELVQWMTRKQPDDRPLSYDDLRERVAALRPEFTLPSARSLPGTSRDRPGAVEPITATVTGLPFPRSGMRRASPWIAAVVVVGLAAAAFMRWGQPSQPTVAVAVMQPSVVTNDQDNATLAARAVRESLLNTVAVVNGLVAVDPGAIDEIEDGPAAVGRATAADEVVVAELEATGGQFSVTLRRVSGVDGTVLWTSGVFEVPATEFQLIADSVAAHLQRGYPERGTRPGVFSSEATPEEYAELLRIKAQLADPPEGVDEHTQLQALTDLRQRAPRLLEVYIAEASVARFLYQVTHREAYIDHAWDVAQAARAVAPNDPRAILPGLEIALAADDVEAAQQALSELERIDPTHQEILTARAGLAELQGQQDEAISIRHEIVRRRPSWRAYLRLGRAELDGGRVNDARTRFETSLDLVPGNQYALSSLAELELLHGSTERAADLFSLLTERHPSPMFHANLGTAHMLLGRFAEAAEEYRTALDMDPGDPSIELVLAECAELRGARGEAESLYSKALENARARTDLEANAVAAQCWAHLGEHVRAARAVQELLLQAPEHPQVLYVAALVYTLIGQQPSAIVNAQRAIEAGLNPRWFALPWFDGLREDDRFSELLDGANASASP